MLTEHFTYFSLQFCRNFASTSDHRIIYNTSYQQLFMKLRNESRNNDHNNHLVIIPEMPPIFINHPSTTSVPFNSPSLMGTQQREFLAHCQPEPTSAPCVRWLGSSHALKGLFVETRPAHFRPNSHLPGCELSSHVLYSSVIISRSFMFMYSSVNSYCQSSVTQVLKWLP